MLACTACGGLRPANLPGDAGGSAYRDYYTGVRPKAAWRSWLRAMADATRRDYLDRRTPPTAGRVLDYGCGTGDYLARLARRRPALGCVGTDAIRPADRGQTYAWLSPSEVGGAGPFDWITLGHVLEHLDDPVATLSLLARTLSPGGGVWIATPNAQSFIIRRAGRWARDIDFPRHRQIFSRKGLDELLAGAGLTPKFLPAPRINAMLNVVSTLKNIAHDRSAPRPERAWAALRTVLHLIVHLIAPAARDSPELVVVCRR